MADQKLNIIFTGDVSQLDKAINEALQDVTNFENKIKGLATLDLSKLSSEIDSIRSKFSTLDIKIDSQKALSELNKISGQLSGVKDVLIDVDVNDAEVKSQIDSIVQRIKAIDLGTLSFPDIQGATSEINQILADLSKLKDTDVLLKVDNAPALAAINQVEANLKDVRSNIVVQVDSTKINQDIQDIKTKFAAFGEIDIKADPAGALAAIDKILIDINSVKSQEVILQADNSEALDSINDVQSRLQSVKSNILVSVDIGQSVEVIKARFQTLDEIDIKANPDQALKAVDLVLADIAKLKTSELFIKVNNTEALAAINKVESAAQSIKAKFVVDTSSFDTSKLKTLFSSFSGGIELKVNTETAEAEIASLITLVNGLRDKDILINIDGTQVIRTADQIEKELIRLKAALKSATDPKDVARLTQSLTTLKNSLGGVNSNQFSRPFSNLSNAANEANFSLLNVGRIAQDLPFGLIGIANNINPAVESFARLSTSAKEAGVSVGSVLLKSLTGTGGLLFGVSLITSALQFAAIGLSAFTRGFGGAKTEIDAATISLGQFNEKLARTQSGVDNFKLGATFRTDLKKVTAEAGGLEGEALDIFGLQKSIEANKLLIKQVDKQADEIAKPLARINTGIEKIKDAQRFSIPASALKFGITEAEAKKKFGDPILNVIEQFKDITLIPESALEGLEKADREVVDELIKLNKDISSINKTREELVNQNELSLLKIRVAANKQQERLDDEILKRARQFVKEFGDAFVVPDLEEKFFTKKSDLVRAAKKLLGNLDKLQIKFPVELQADISTVPVVNDDLIAVFSKDKNGIMRAIEISLKRLQENFQSGLGLELEIPVTVTPDVSLSKDSLKQIDEKLKLREQFSVLGDLGINEFNKIDFTNINKGIQEGTRLLQGMVDIASTLNQSIGAGLTNAFNAAFDAALEGKNVFKALGEALKQLIIGTIKAIAQMLILKAITSLIFPGLNTPLPLSIPGISRGRVGSAAPSFGGIGGGRLAPSLSVTLRGTDLAISLNGGLNQIGRVG